MFFLIQLQPSKTYIQIMLRPIRWNPRMVGIRLFSITRLNFNTNNNTRASPSSSSLFAYIHDYNTLLEKVKSTITSNSSESDILEAMNGIKNLQSNYPIQDQINDTSKLTKQSISIINTIFKNDDDRKFSSKLLHDILILNLPSSLNIKVIKHYYKSNPTDVISKEVALIPLRNAIFNAEFMKAIKLTDLTVGHENYINHMNQILKSGVIKLISTAVIVTLFTKLGVSSLIDAGVISQSWQSIGAINSIILTYLINSSFFISIVKLGRTLINSGGDYLTWQKGTFYTHWFKHADEMLFSSKIIEADRELNQGESNPDIIEELCRRPPDDRDSMRGLKPGVDRDGNKIRLLQLKDDLNKVTFQAYWMTGGDGFEWIEPDQDPADIQWRKHLELYNKPALKQGEFGALGWADDLIQKSTKDV